MIDNNIKPPRKTFQNFRSSKTFSKKPLTIRAIRRAMEKMRESQVRPDLEGNMNFVPGFGFVDERDYWLLGKPVGGAS